MPVANQIVKKTFILCRRAGIFTLAGHPYGAWGLGIEGVGG